MSESSARGSGLVAAGITLIFGLVDVPLSSWLAVPLLCCWSLADLKRERERKDNFFNSIPMRFCVVYRLSNRLGRLLSDCGFH